MSKDIPAAEPSEPSNIAPHGPCTHWCVVHVSRPRLHPQMDTRSHMLGIPGKALELVAIATAGGPTWFALYATYSSARCVTPQAKIISANHASVTTHIDAFKLP